MAVTLAWAVTPAQATTVTFNFTGAEQTFTVPVGVSRVHVVAIGGHGGESDVAGGAAAQVGGDLLVNPGQILYVAVGGVGQDGDAGALGGFNGGGAGGFNGGAGGGGASDVRTAPLSAGFLPEPRLIVAAGGGGGGGTGMETVGATGGAAGSNGGTGSLENGGGEAGTSLAGGSGGSGCSGIAEAGAISSGGVGGGSVGAGGGGGGGGGGLYGGGGGSAGCNLLGGGGGGGGSSLMPAGGSFALASLAAAPKVQITYTPPPSITISSPIDGATYTRDQAVAAAYACMAQEGAGVTSCTGPVANGAALDTATLGQHSFKVDAKDTDGSTASKSVSYTVVAPAPPNTVLGSHPKKRVKTKKKRVKVKFAFSSTTPGATFKCKLDKGPFAPCTSPKTYKVKPGKHMFSVEAVGAGGTDSTPATFPFKVKKKH